MWVGIPLLAMAIIIVAASEHPLETDLKILVIAAAVAFGLFAIVLLIAFLLSRKAER